MIAKLPKRQDLQNRVRDAYWADLDQAGSAADGEARLRGLVGELESEYPGAAAALAEDLPALSQRRSTMPNALHQVAIAVVFGAGRRVDCSDI